MRRTPTKTNTFSYKKENGNNPYVGFFTFQHFNGDPIYSDCVVTPEGKMCETENYECYPVPEDVEEKGNEQGFYPDGTVAYIRFLWKEFEREQGVYDYDFIESFLDKAKKCGQSVIIRIMPHSTRARDDVPEWLKKLVECPERPDGKRIKDSPTDPLFFELFLKAVRKIGERFDEDERLYAIDICLPGAWGEGHKLELYGEDLYDRITQAYASAFKKTLLFGQCARPDLIQKMSKSGLTVGWRGDGFGHEAHLEKVYPERVKKLEDHWKTAPVSFESYWWLGEWKRQGWNIDKIIDKSLEWHVSSFNGKSLPIPFEWKDKVDYWLGKMGYHLVIDSFSFPEKVTNGDTAEFELCIDNIGVAPMYKKTPLVLVLEGEKETFEAVTAVDCRKWLPGKTREVIQLDIPEELQKGRYDIKIQLRDSYYPHVYFATDAPGDGVVVTVGQLELE